MMGMKVKPSALREIIEEIDEDGRRIMIMIKMMRMRMRIFSIVSLPLSLSSTQIGSGLLEFGEFCQLAAKFLVEEDEEALKKELKEAFR